jgi:type I restriction enzyme S subunit
MIAGRIKSKYIIQDVRFNSGYFLNEDAVNSRALEENREKCLQLTELADVWNPPIFKRQFCQETERAIPYCQSSDVTNALEGSDVFINKIQATKVGSVVEENQILITGFGTIGNTRLVNELNAGISYANNVCRVKAHKEVLFGYLYAVLTSKYGRSQLNKNASGSVVRYIEAPGIKKTLIPILSNSNQQEIHNLIVEASNLRVEANKLLSEAQNKIIEVIGFEKKGLGNKISVSKILNSHQSRFEAAYYFSYGMEIRKHIETLNHKLLKDISKPIFRPGIFKRHYVAKGIDFLGGADIVKAIPKSDKKLSIAKTPHLNSLKIEEDWILVTCGGTIGFSVLVNKFMKGKTASQHILRVIANEIPTGYLFAFMSSRLGLNAIQSFTYGSVIPQIEPHHLELLPVPILDKNVMNSTHELIMKYKNNVSKAIYNELEAIEIVEKEIESWQK